ncbi:MAG: ECF transporter S component, partial [Elusimicrobiaceae bacterium]
MNKKSIIKIVGFSVIAGLVYGVSNYVSSKIYLPGCSFIELRPQVALPMFIGAFFGPLAGFVTGFLGDRIGYAFQGLSLGYAWNWSVGNGFIGMIPGALHLLKIKEIKSIRDYTLLLMLVVSASFFPIVFASSIDIAIRKLSLLNTVYSLILPAFITDAVFGLILVPLFLIVAGRMRFTIGIRNMLLSTYLLLFAVLTTYMVSAVSMWNDTGSQSLNYKDIYNIGVLSLVVLLAGLSVS